ncbi:MAG: hypothetical protein BWK79_03715 [Beggiatoa sp. IS2]|nr:MAG: hypothetical protein BWK79_03715 [Beggiatoa sp. IS2]
MKKQSEGRRYIRHATTILITVISADKKIANLQSLNDISAGGLSFESENRWEKNMDVIISFHPPFDFSEEILRLAGKVIWCKKVDASHFSVGIEFINPSDSAVDIMHLVEEMYREH